MSIRPDLGNWVAHHNQLLWSIRMDNVLKRSQVPPAIAPCAIEWGDRRRLRLPSQLAHAVKDDRAVAIHALGPSLQGSRQDCREARRLLPADISGCSFVIVATRRLSTINTRAPFHYVEVDFQNAPFAEDEFGDRHEGHLCALAEEGTVRSEEQVFDELLCNGGSSTNAIALQILLGSNLDFVPIESMVLVEVRVLCGDDSVLEVGRDLGERNELVAFAIRREVTPGLQAALDVHRGCGWVDP